MKKQNIIKLVFIFILSIIVVAIISNINKETNYLNFEYKIESIDYREKGVYLTFFDDETKEQKEANVNIEYVVYHSNVNTETLRDLKAGDLVNITVEDNHGTFTYTIIYEMKYNNDVLFNIMKEYSELDINNAIVFISAISSIIIYLIFLCVYKEEVRQNKVTDFVIKNPLWEKYLSIGTIVGAMGFILPFSFLYVLGKCNFDYFAFSFVLYIFIILGSFGTYICVKEKFVLQNQTFTYHKIFGKTCSVKVSQISHVNLVLNYIGRLCKVEFYDYKNQIALSFVDDGRSFTDDLFMNACKLYRIPVKVDDSRVKKQTEIDYSGD